MQDFSFDFGSFSSTEAEVKALTDGARAFLASMFGAGAVSLKLPKSKAADLMRYFQQRGFTIR